jgi:dTDP-4-amino-4,6-dideoxygalactose transaminase
VSVPLLDLQAQFQAIRESVMPALLEVIERQQFIMGPEVSRLEEAVAGLTGARHAVACASGTDALLIPLRLLRLQPGDEVITPAFTFFATAGAIHNAGGTPVFADIDPATFNLDPAAIEAAITPRTRAVVVVHLFGQMAPMERILSLAERHGLAVIEDAAQAIGAARQVSGRRAVAGTLGTVGTLSFFPTKNLGAWGDGGMMLTSDDALAAKLRAHRLHGGTREYHHDEVGLNSRLDTLQAAVLLAKLPFLPAWSAARAARARRYGELLAGVPEVTVPVTAPGNEHIWHQYTVRHRRRDDLAAHLRARGIGHKIYYPLALHLQPCFAHLGYRPGSLPATEAATAQVLSLPCYPELTAAQQEEVADAIRDFSSTAR